MADQSPEEKALVYELSTIKGVGRTTAYRIVDVLAGRDPRPSISTPYRTRLVDALRPFLAETSGEEGATTEDTDPHEDRISETAYDEHCERHEAETARVRKQRDEARELVRDQQNLIDRLAPIAFNVIPAIDLHEEARFLAERVQKVL